jgi:uncharacterized damage-inducible protein DinB
MDLAEQLLDTWRIHNRIVLYILDAVPAEALAGVAANKKGRTVGAMFAHLHSTRLMWLELTPALMKGLSKIAKEQATDKALLQHSLRTSGQALESLLKAGLESGKIKGFKPHPTAFAGYAIAHEAYHLGEIGVVLTQSSHPLDKSIAYGMWEWGKR